jgi:predicted enzyme related to lactoylglutathione lyase
MTHKESYAPGTPSWVDLGTPDLDATVAFYESLFGWKVERGGEDVGGYSMATLDGATVAGLGPLMGEGQPTAWTTYISVADADAATEKVRANGGTVLAEPMDVMDAGRMANFFDPTGAFFAIWQPGTTIGAQVVNEPGTLCWNELQTRDLEATKAFYTAVFGWGLGGDPASYVQWQVGGQSVGAAMPCPTASRPRCPTAGSPTSRSTTSTPRSPRSPSSAAR